MTEDPSPPTIAAAATAPPPGWAVQPPIGDVALWYDKRVLLLNNTSKAIKRCTLERALTGHAKTERFDIVVRPNAVSHQVVWLEGTDTGGIRLVDVQTAQLDGKQDGLKSDRCRLYTEQVPGDPPGWLVGKIENRWSVPVFVSVIMATPTLPTPAPVQTVVDANVPHSPIWSNQGPVTVTWHAAELQRVTLYGIWPPAA